VNDHRAMVVRDGFSVPLMRPRFYSARAANSRLLHA